MYNALFFISGGFPCFFDYLFGYGRMAIKCVSFFARLEPLVAAVATACCSRSVAIAAAAARRSQLPCSLGDLFPQEQLCPRDGGDSQLQA